MIGLIITIIIIIISVYSMVCSTIIIINILEIKKLIKKLDKDLENNKKFSKEQTSLLKKIYNEVCLNTKKWLDLEVGYSKPLANDIINNNNKGF